MTYIILTNSTLDTNLANWGIWQTLTASNSVIVAPPFNIGTNSIFFAANLVLVSDNNALPDWWELEYGLNPSVTSSSTNGVSDLYADPAGDGWSNLQKYQNGWNPNLFYTPPPPLVSVNPLPGDNGVTITWHPNQGLVTGYTIFRNGSPITTVSSNQLSYQDTSAGVSSYYQVRANYANGNSTLSTPQNADNANLVVSIVICRGPQSQYYLLAPNIPKGVTSLLFGPYIDYYEDWPYYEPFDIYLEPLTNFVPNLTESYFEVPVTNFIQGRYAVPNSLLPYFGFYFVEYQAIGTNGAFGPISYAIQEDFAQDIPSDDAWLQAERNRYWWNVVPFLDGTTQLQQNLAFQLESADMNGPFQFTVDGTGDNRPSDVPVNGVSGVAFPASYASANFHEAVAGQPFWINEFKPFEDNYFYRNFVVNSAADVNSQGSIASGVYYATSGDPYNIQISNRVPYAFPEYAYALLGGTNPIAPLLTTNAQWIYSPFPAGGNIPLSWINYTNLTLASGQFNSFGLDYQSAVEFYSNSGALHSNSVSSGQVVFDPAAYYGDTSYFYAKVVAPHLNTVGYYYALTDRDPVPGSPAFAITNTVAPIIASAGVPLLLGAWAEQGILNGNGNQRAFLELYWDKAFAVNADGDVTTNQTGILSEYGEFLPTDPGLVVLTTKTNAGAGQGQITVPVIGLYADVNHDGLIDTSFSGPDCATPARPFRFWVNDNNDSGDTGGNDIPGYPAALGRGQVPNGLSGVVNGTRDLVDFFPVYVDIGSVLQVMGNDSLQFRLSQADGALNFVETVFGTNSSHAYLSYPNSSTYSDSVVTQITPAGVMLSSRFVKGVTNDQGIILVEAWTNTTAPLVLDVLLGTNVVAQAQLPLSITGVEQMFRHKNLTSAVLGQTDGPGDRLTDSDVPNAPDDNGTNFIFVHGYNVNPNQARGSQSAMFKRLYWSGSNARFYGVTWDGYDTQRNIFTTNSITPNYQTNALHAFQTAPQLATFLAGLTGTNIVAAHSLGNMVVLSALNDYNANISTYFMIDAAVAIEAIDPAAGVNTNMVHPQWNPYNNNTWASYWYQLFATNDNRSQLNWTGRLTNFASSQVYNFYSSGEEVLRTSPGQPPTVLAAVYDQVVLNGIFGQNPVGAFAWAWQEKMKGRTAGNWILGSNHGGWGFNTNYGTANSPPSSTVVNALTSSQLQTNPVFNTDYDGQLFGSGGSTYAHVNRNNILADAIPALSLPIGANSVGRLAPTGQPNQNFDMQSRFESGWAFGRPPVSVGAAAPGEWHHSDLTVVAYPYTHTMFDQLVTLGNLQ